MKEFKGTPGTWVADIRGGVAQPFTHLVEMMTPRAVTMTMTEILPSLARGPNTTGCIGRLMAALSMILI